MILWTTVFFYFSVEEVLISGSFPSVGVQKSSMLGFFCFTEGELLVFALHPLMERIKNQIEISIYCREQSIFSLTHAYCIASIEQSVSVTG